jgi:hypothetical protein
VTEEQERIGMSDIIKAKFCPHCGNMSPQRVIKVQECEWVGRSLTNDEELNLGRTYFVALCGTCNHILLYSIWGNDHGEESYAEIFADTYLQYPDSLNLNIAVPERIRDIYEEAARIKLTSPNGFANQIGRAIEALCKDRGAKGKNLHQQIKDLVERKELPARLADALVLLKDLRNVGAHDNEIPIKLSQVDTIDKFFRAVVEYVYVTPRTVKDLRESMSHPVSEDGAGTADDA